MYKPARDPRFQEFQGDHGRKSFLGFHAMIATVDAVFPGGDMVTPAPTTRRP